MAEILRPSYIYQSEEDSRCRTLLYSPSLNSFIFGASAECLGAVRIDCQTRVKRIVHWTELDERNALAISSDGSLMAMSSRVSCPSDEGPLTRLSIYQLPNVITNSHNLITRRSFSMLPDLGSFFVSSLKFFPDGKHIIAALMQDPFEDERTGNWCRIYKIQENLWNEGQITTTTGDNLLDNREFKTFEFDDIDVIQQGLMAPEIFKNRTDVEIWPSKSAKCGFYSVAISPDTTRILTGSYDGEIFIFETSSLKLLQRVRGYVKLFERLVGKDYEYDVRVLSCHYNPVFAHHEFVTCGHNFQLEIWRVDELQNGVENAHIIHQLSLAPHKLEYYGGCCCTYSPDGKLIALTCEDAEEVKTSIIDSRSGNVLYSLVYKEGFSMFSPGDYSLCHNMFVGNLCQVAAVSYDDRFCIWKLPVVYSLETLCFLIIRASVKYDNVDQLCLPLSLKLRLKYLYV